MSDSSIPAHLTPKRFKLSLECARCGNSYTRTVSERHYIDILRNIRPDPECPRKICREAFAVEDAAKRAANMSTIITEQRAPAKTGSTLAKAVDFTAETVMADYSMTDMRDNNRVGENSVPKLPLPQQEKVDNFFGTQRAQIAQTNPELAKKVAGFSTLAASGALANQPDAKVISGMLSNAPKLRHTGTVKYR